MNSQHVKVWDPFVRVFHWTLAGTFAIAYLTEDDFLTLHTWAGYTTLGLVLSRVLWGLVGTRYARFSSFVFSPLRVWSYVKETFSLRAPRYIGHNPAGGAMTVLLLASVCVTALTGVVLYGAEESAGPLASLAGSLGNTWGESFEEVHEFFANFTLLLVLIHVAGVLVESMIHRENLIKAMWTGYKRSNPRQYGRGTFR